MNARQTALTPARFRVGDYEFREMDYRQILIWSESLAMAPETIIRRLENASCAWNTNPCAEAHTTVFKVEHGRMISLAWDLSELTLKTFDWIPDLSIQELAIYGTRADCPNISLSLRCLRKLFVGSINLKNLTLSNVSELTELRCGVNELTGIDLSGVPSLTELWCNTNRISSLDLSKVPRLKKLRCETNKLIALDVSCLPDVTTVICFFNNINKLDVRANTALKYLSADFSVEVNKLPSQKLERPRYLGLT